MVDNIVYNNFMKRTVLWMTAWLLWSAPQAPPAPPGADVKVWLAGRTAAFSGVVLVGRGDAVEALAASGLADRAAGRRNAAATRFNLGSINKTFTAVAVAQLVQHGRVSLDDVLLKHVPDYPNRPAAEKITVRDLLSHRAGVATFMRADFGSASVAEMTRVVGSEPQVFEPGARQEYSNGGYILLSRIVETASGRSYADYVAEHIYRRAGMTASGFVTAADAGSVALGYFGADAQGRPMMGGPSVGSNPPAPGNPAGGGYSTAEDLFSFARALRTGRLLDQRTTDYGLHG